MCFNTLFFSSFLAASRLPRVAHGMICGDIVVVEGCLVLEDVEEVDEEEERRLDLLASSSTGT